MSFDTSHQNDRPNIDGKVNGRIDVTSLTRLILEGRFILATDYPGSPNIQAGLAHFPIYTTVGASAGIGQRFNRFDVTFKAGFDRTEYQPSVFVDGERVSNADRNYDQYSTTLRTTYDLSPQLRPFAEISGNERLHPVPLDRFGLDRDSVGYSAKAGAAVDFTRTLTGELAAGYLNQMYRDPLPNVGGFSVDGALVWSATALTSQDICEHGHRRIAAVSGIRCSHPPGGLPGRSRLSPLAHRHGEDRVCARYLRRQRAPGQPLRGRD